MKNEIKNREAVKRWRRKTKERIILAMGGECVCCSYKKCNRALALHHLDPTKKEISFGKIRANPKSWLKIIEELRKCVLVCHNCHSEIHEGIREVPKNAKRFNEKFVKYKEQREMDKCPICQKLKPIQHKTCSLNCGAKIRYNVDWDKIDLIDLVENKIKNYAEIGRMLKCSDNAVRKRYFKLKSKVA